MTAEKTPMIRARGFEVMVVALLFTAYFGGYARSDELKSWTDFVTAIRDETSFKNADADLRAAMLAIAGLASEYGGLNESDVRNLPGVEHIEEAKNGAWLQADLYKDDGVRTRIRFNLQGQHSQSAKVTYPDKSGVGVDFTRLVEQDAVAMRRGHVTFEGGQQHIEFDFGQFGPNKPFRAIHLVGDPPHAMVQGKFILWDAEGDVIVERHIPEARPLLQVQSEIVSSLNADELDALGASQKERLYANSAFQQGEQSLRRSIENLAGWSERFLDAQPSEFVARLRGREMETIEREDETVYHITVGADEPDWTIAQNRASGSLQTATRNRLTLYFDKVNNQQRLVGGCSPFTELGVEDRYWLVSFYPGKCAPRMAVAAKGEPPTDLNVEGKLFVWGPDGEILVEKNIETPRSVEEVVQEIDAALTDQDKQAVHWRGLQEADYLLGQY